MQRLEQLPRTPYRRTSQNSYSTTFVHKEAGARPGTLAPCRSTAVYGRFWFTADMHVPWSGQPKSLQPPFLHCAFVVGTQCSTVKDACPDREPSLAVLVNVPHSVVAATMVTVKGWVEVKVTSGHVTVLVFTFVLIVHWKLGSLSSTDTILNPDGSSSTRAPKAKHVLIAHRSVMVKVIRSPTVTVLGFAVLSIQ